MELLWLINPPDYLKLTVYGKSISGLDLEHKCYYICKTECIVWYNDLLYIHNIQAKCHKDTEFYIKKYTKNWQKLHKKGYYVFHIKPCAWINTVQGLLRLRPKIQGLESLLLLLKTNFFFCYCKTQFKDCSFFFKTSLKDHYSVDRNKTQPDLQKWCLRLTFNSFLQLLNFHFSAAQSQKERMNESCKKKISENRTL